MRWSKTTISTLRDDPQDAEIMSHKLMVRAGLLRKLSGGLYIFSPLGLRVLHKVEKIIREEMDNAGAQEILMPALQPIELWEKSGRASRMGESMFRLKDRQGRIMVLGPTHEEVVTDYIAGLVSSYRQLPCTVYQIQTKFRDEIRPRFGLMRAKEFIMKDAYSFDVSFEAADASYKAMYDAYVRIFERCGLVARPVEADTGAIGGDHSHEFMVPAPSGEDGILECGACGYAANQERAERKIPALISSGGSGQGPEEVATPGAHTVKETAAAVGVPENRVAKSIIYVADGKPIMAVVEGTREINECKLRRVLGCAELSMADEEQSRAAAGPTGSIGPAGVKIPVYADIGLRGATDMVIGANREGFHIKHMNFDSLPEITSWEDLVTAESGDMCPRCGKPMRITRGIEVGHVFKLGTKYTDAFDASFLDSEKNSRAMVMGCYGIGVTRTVQAVVEQNFDCDGIIWPASVSPCQVELLPLDAPKNPACMEAAEQLVKELETRGIDVFVDDRDERPGVKFKDADLIGFPVRVVIGMRSLEKGGAEVRVRRTGASEIIPLDKAASAISGMLAAL